MGQSQTKSMISLFGKDCTSCFTGSKDSRKQSNLSWKEHVLEQLRFFSEEKWAATLIEFLETQKTEAEDVMFQSDIFWADFNSARGSKAYPINPFECVRVSKSSHLNPVTFGSEEDLGQDNDRPVIHQSGLEEQNKKTDLFGDIKNMLETSDILDEKVLSASHQETWMDKAYDIKVVSGKKTNTVLDARKAISSPRGSPKKTKMNEYGQEFNNGDALKLSFDYYKSPISVRKHTSPLNTRPSAAGSSRQSFKNSLDDYHNNTLICNYPVEKDEIYHEDENLETEEINRQNEEEIYKGLKNYKMITKIIDKHLKMPMNIFCRLIGCFETYFCEAYGSVNSEGKNISNNYIPSESIEETKRATTELQQFIRILYEGVNIFYKLDRLKIDKRGTTGITLFARDNIVNFLASIVFTEKIHDTLFNLYQFQSYPVEEAFEKKLKRCQNKQPQDFGVSDLFSLNERTILTLKAQNKIPQLRLENNKRFNKRLAFEGINCPESEFNLPSPKENDNTNKDFYFAIEGKTEESELKPAEVQTTEKEDPYSPAISMLSNLERRKSPIHKLKTIVKVAELASAAVDKFYRDLGINSFKKVDSDQTMFIFLYILVKSKLTDVIAHCKIIQNFSTGNILDSISGYYATTLEACVNYMGGMNIEDGEVEAASPGDLKFTSMPSHLGSEQQSGVRSIG